jgi:hypothetical protein
MKLFEKYALKEVSENELSMVLCRIEEFIYSVAKNIADKDLAFSYRDFNEDELGSLYTFLMDEDIPYIEDKIGDVITIRSDAVWKEILKHKALKNPGRVMVMRLIEELGTCDEYSEIIGVIDFGKDGSIEREQFKTIMPSSILNKIAYGFVGILLLIIISSVVKLAVTSSNNAKEVVRLQAEIQIKDIEIAALKTSIEIEQRVAEAAEQENESLRLASTEYLKKYEDLKVVTAEKKNTGGKKVVVAKDKVKQVIEDKTQTPVLTLDESIDVTNIADSTEVNDYMQTQIQEAYNLAASLADHVCLIQEAEAKEFNDTSRTCNLQTL